MVLGAVIDAICLREQVGGLTARHWIDLRSWSFLVLMPVGIDNESDQVP